VRREVLESLPKSIHGHTNYTPLRDIMETSDFEKVKIKNKVEVDFDVPLRET
jgi:hypothetical protein